MIRLRTMKTMSFDTLKLQHDSDLATLTLNRPEKRNAISPEMIDELLRALDEAESSRARVVIITGAGTAFCAGMDLDTLKALAAESPQHTTQDAALRSPGATRVPGGARKAADPRGSRRDESSTPPALESSRRIASLFRRIYSFPKPLIAAVNGPAIAGGCGIATLADFTLAVPEAKFGYTEVRIGFIPAIVSVFLIRQIGEKRARDLLLTGRTFDADEARQMGLVNEVVPRGRLLERARELATTLLAASPESLVYTKRLLREFAEAEIDREVELAVRENASIRSTADFREGISAFLEKRKPSWRGD